MCVAIILSRIIKLNAVVRDHQQYDRVVKQQFYKWFKKITRLLLLKIVHGEHQQNNWKEHLQFYKISWWWTLLLLSTCIFSLLWHFCEHPWLRIKFLRYVVYKPHLLLLLLLYYISFKCKDPLESLTKLNMCISDNRVWMIKTKLKINNSKTEFIIFLSPLLKQNLSDLSISVWDTQVTPSSKVRDLGVLYDQYLTFNDHINGIYKSTHFHLHSIGRIRNRLTFDDTAKLIHASKSLLI